MSKATNDPWAPQSSIPRLSMPGDLDPRKLNVSSEEYIATLEAKLKKLQGKSGKGKQSKDMLKSLGDAREHQMQGFLQDTNPYSTSHMGEDDDDADAPQLSAIQKKLHPERQALTQEELKVLVDHDDLAKRVSALLDTDNQTPGDELFPFNEYKSQELNNKTDAKQQNGEAIDSKTVEQSDKNTSEMEKSDSVLNAEQSSENSTTVVSSNSDDTGT